MIEMSINYFLCKYFDDERKGYVDIKDVILMPFKLLIGFIVFIVEHMMEISFTLMIFLSIGTISAFVQGFFPDKSPGVIETIIIILKGWIVPLIIILLGYLFGKPIRYILSVKVAKCPLKEKEN